MSQKSPLFTYGQKLADSVNEQEPRDCIQAAKMVLDTYQNTIADTPELAHVPLQCGVVFEIRNDVSRTTRLLHASNFLLARNKDGFEYISVDAHNKGVRHDNDLVEVAPVLNWSKFGLNSIGYVEKVTDDMGDTVHVRGGITKNLRKRPYDILPNAMRAVVVGEVHSTTVIDEYDDYQELKWMAGYPVRPLNKKNLPLLLLKRDPTHE